MSLPDIRTVAKVMGGDVVKGQALVPGPGHSQKDRSLSIKIDSGAPGGFICFSHAGDDDLACKDYVRERLGIRREGAQPEHPSASITRMADRAKPKARVVGEYVYKQADGTPYLKVLRTEDKEFPQQRWTGTDWAWGAPKGPKIPYRLPELQRAVHDTVFIVEGEKDADNLATKGFIATTSSEGAGKWRPELNEHFRGKRVFILPDNDDAGRKHAHTIAENLVLVANEVRILALPGLTDKGDVSDWLDAAGDTGQLVSMAEAAPIWTPQSAAEVAQIEPPCVVATAYEWREPSSIPRRDWLYGRLLVRKFVSATVAPGGVGKSSLIAAEALAMVSGKPLLGVSSQRRRVWLWNLEDPREETERKIQATAKRYRIEPADIGDRLFVDSGRDQRLVIAEQTRNGAMIVRPVVDGLVAEIAARGIDVVVIDPFVSCHSVPENDNTAQDTIVKEWGKVADRADCSIHLIDHTRKGIGGDTEVTTESSRGAKSKTDACRVVRVLNRMSKDEGEKAGVENHRLYFRAYNDKANLAPPADESEWYRLESVDLENGTALGPGDSVGVVHTWQWPDAMDGVTGGDFDRVAATIRAGKWRENAQSGDWVGRAVANALDLDPDNKADKAKIKGMLKVWLTAGSLAIVEAQDEKRMTRKFVAVADAA